MSASRNRAFLLGGAAAQRKGRGPSSKEEGNSARRQACGLGRGEVEESRRLSLRLAPCTLPTFLPPQQTPGPQPALVSRQCPSFELLFHY